MIAILQSTINVLEGNHMAGARDADGQFVIFAADLAHGEDVKQLRVQRPPVELKDEIAHRRSQKINAHDWSSGPYRETTPPDYRQAFPDSQCVFQRPSEG